MDQWLETYARPTVKLSTYCSYEMMIRVHIKPTLAPGYGEHVQGAHGNLDEQDAAPFQV